MSKIILPNSTIIYIDLRDYVLQNNINNKIFYACIGRYQKYDLRAYWGWMRYNYSPEGFDIE